MDKKGIDKIHKAEEEYRKGEYVTVQSSSEIKKLTE